MGIRCAHCASFSSPGPFSRGHSVTEAERVTDLHEVTSTLGRTADKYLSAVIYTIFTAQWSKPLLYCTQVVPMRPLLARPSKR